MVRWKVLEMRGLAFGFTWDKELWRQKSRSVNHHCYSVRAVRGIKGWKSDYHREKCGWGRGWEKRRQQLQMRSKHVEQLLLQARSKGELLYAWSVFLGVSNQGRCSAATSHCTARQGATAKSEVREGYCFGDGGEKVLLHKERKRKGSE